MNKIAPDQIRLDLVNRITGFFTYLLISRINDIEIFATEQLDYMDFILLDWRNLEIMRSQVGQFISTNLNAFVVFELKILGKIMLDMAVQAEELSPDGKILARRAPFNLNKGSV